MTRIFPGPKSRVIVGPGIAGPSPEPPEPPEPPPEPPPTPGVPGEGRRVRVFSGSRKLGPVVVGPAPALPPPPPPPPPATCFTLAEARRVLAERLYEWGCPSFPAPMQFMAPPDIDLYIREALQTFNAYCHFYRREFQFQTEPGQAWYDITEEPTTLRPMTTLDHDLLSIIEYQLLERQTPTYPLDWEGTRQFCIPDLLNGIQQARDQLLSESGCTVNQSLVPAVPGRTFLDDSVMDIRRLSWLPDREHRRFSPNMVQPSDIWATQSFHALFPERPPGTPLIYRRTTEPPVSFDVDIQPAVSGQYDVLTTNTDVDLSTAHPTLIPIPNDWTHIVKYGALAQLFGRESAAKDVLRESYCLKRWKQGLALIQSAAAALAARVNNRPIIINSMMNGDFYFANWQGRRHDRPQYLLYSGLNMFALAPIPDKVYTVQVSVVENMPLPFADTDCLLVGRNDFFPLMDLAQHIAMQKVGGQEFAATYPLYGNFLRHCALYNAQLQAMSLWLEWIDGRPQEELIRINPKYSPTADPIKLQGEGVLSGG